MRTIKLSSFLSRYFVALLIYRCPAIIMTFWNIRGQKGSSSLLPPRFLPPVFHRAKPQVCSPMYKYNIFNGSSYQFVRSWPDVTIPTVSFQIVVPILITILHATVIKSHRCHVSKQQTSNNKEAYPCCGMPKAAEREKATVPLAFAIPLINT